MMKYIVFEWEWSGEGLGVRTWMKVMEANTYAICERWVAKQEHGHFLIVSVSKEVNK